LQKVRRWTAFLSDNHATVPGGYVSGPFQTMMEGSRTMGQTQEKKPHIEIDEEADGTRKVVLRPDNNDIFVQTGKQVIAACSLGISLDLWLDEVGSLIHFVTAWTEKRAASITSCFVEPRPRCIMLFFVPASDSFDFDLADELVKLNSRLIKDFNVGLVETHQIPESELDRFLNPPMAKQIYGNAGQSHNPVAT
jgi:hypothetical protein